MPMTCPLTFSSPPAGPVEAYRARNDVVGDRMLENLEMGARGSYEKKVSQFKLLSGNRFITYSS